MDIEFLTLVQASDTVGTVRTWRGGQSWYGPSSGYVLSPKGHVGSKNRALAGISELCVDKRCAVTTTRFS